MAVVHEEDNPGEICREVIYTLFAVFEENYRFGDIPMVLPYSLCDFHARFALGPLIVLGKFAY